MGTSVAFPIADMTYSNKSNLKEEGFILVHDSRLQFVRCLEIATLHPQSRTKEDEYTHACAQLAVSLLDNSLLRE